MSGDNGIVHILMTDDGAGKVEVFAVAIGALRMERHLRELGCRNTLQELIDHRRSLGPGSMWLEIHDLV